jgi:pimeloyl-ACP methyl ester carboxylesterase
MFSSPGSAAVQDKFLQVQLGEATVSTHYWELGDGPNHVLFLQTGGAGTTAQMCWYLSWGAFADAGYHVIAPDAPSFGQTAPAPGSPGPVPAPAFTVALMDALGIESAHFAGNSMGSMTITRIAIDHPERVRSVILTGGEPRVDTEASAAIAPTLGRTARMDFVRAMLSKPEIDPADLRHATADFFYDRDHPRIDEVSAMRLEDLRRPGVQEREREAAFRQIQGGRANYTAADMGQIRAPTLLVHGRDERYFFSEETAPALIEAGVKTAFVIPDASCVLLSHCAHWPQIEKADTFNSVALSFLAGVGA